MRKLYYFQKKFMKYFKEYRFGCVHMLSTLYKMLAALLNLC